MTFVVYTIQKMKKNGKMVKKNLRKNGQNKVHIYISILMINGLMENSVSGKCIIILQDLLALIQIWKVLMVILKPFLPRENDYQ